MVYRFVFTLKKIFAPFIDILNDGEICDLQEVAFTRPFLCAPAVPLLSPLQDLIKIK